MAAVIPTAADVGRIRAQLIDLTVEAERLAAGVASLTVLLEEAPSGPARIARFRLGEALGAATALSAQLEATAGDLRHVMAALTPGVCAAPWGVCPDHGVTLSGFGGGQSRCLADGRTWRYDRLGSPCEERVSHLVVDLAGHRLELCPAHTRDAVQRLPAAAAEPLVASMDGTAAV